MKSSSEPAVFSFDCIADMMGWLGLPGPQHPLIALINYHDVKPDLDHAGSRILLHFYKISFKTSFKGMVRYGPGQYDFKDGGMAFLGPRQLVELSGESDGYEGYALFFHPHLLRNYSLANSIAQYGFFSYDVREALFLSEKEKQVIKGHLSAMEAELAAGIDQFTQDVLVSQIALLLDYSNRFYNRQFQTRKAVNHDLISSMSKFLDDRLETTASGLPSAGEVAGHLQVSQRYLSDMLKSLTGQTTQQHIHLYLIEKAKGMLSQTALTTAEIVYTLGFEHPQSFNKLFKQKTNMTPVCFRRLFG